MRVYRRPLLGGMIGAVLLSWGGPVGDPGPEHRADPGRRSEGLARVAAIGRGPVAVSSPAPSSARRPRDRICPPGRSGPSPTPGAVDPPGNTASPRADVSIRPGRIGEVGPSLEGVATWYRWRPGEAAAGPGLRAFLGKSWRGTEITVSRGSRSVRVRLTDWCACRGDRIVDLDVRAFAALGDPSRGILQVEVSR